ncbi:hypothetical protein [Bacillus alkalicellulosilyticus]|uniref:hypothetical protein n=1 Tax=Alkalihalobacterium alkalicellulosilyticum TaxID=1912214 RepID=UPI000996EEB9|nr:hypothetical protein [Bacillus alkalicellulosilyticus]
MQRRRIIRFLIIFLLILVTSWLFLNYLKYNVRYYQLFKEQRELFEEIKDGVESIDDTKLEYTNENWGAFLYIPSYQYHDEVDPSLQDTIRLMKVLSKGALSRLTYDERDGENLLTFTFDWERVDGDTYHIVYCKSGKVVES